MANNLITDQQASIQPMICGAGKGQSAIEDVLLIAQMYRTDAKGPGRCMMCAQL